MRRMQTSPREGPQFSTLDTLRLISRLLVITYPEPTCASLDDVWMGRGTSRILQHRLNPTVSQILPRHRCHLSVHHHHHSAPPSGAKLQRLKRSGSADEIRTATVFVGWNNLPLPIIRNIKATPIGRINLMGSGTFVQYFRILLRLCSFAPIRHSIRMILIIHIFLALCTSHNSFIISRRRFIYSRNTIKFQREYEK